MKLMRLLPLPLALGAAFTPVHAQSLLELYDAARAQDAAWQSARAQYDASQARAEQARAGLLPSVGLSAGLTRTDAENNNPPSDRSFTSRSTSLSASHPLYRPANRATFEQGQRQVELARLQLTQAGQDLIIRVSQAYFDVLAAQDTLAFVQAQKAAVAEQLAAAKRNFEVGTSTVTDSREAQARYDLVLAQEISAENDLRVKKLALDTLVGRRNATPRPLLVAPVTLPAPVPADPEHWVRQSEELNPAVQQARVAIEIAQIETEKAKAGHLPTLDVNASYSMNRSYGGSASSANDSRPRNASVGLSFNLPLFAGYATQNRIRETLSLEEKARADLENVRRNVAQAVRSAYFGVVSGQGQARALEAAETSSQSALEANRLGYQVGVRINIDVLNAQSQLFQTKRDLAQARYNVLLGHLKLRQVNGSLQPEDLTRLNALLVK